MQFSLKPFDINIQIGFLEIRRVVQGKCSWVFAIFLTPQKLASEGGGEICLALYYVLSIHLPELYAGLWANLGRA